MEIIPRWDWKFQNFSEDSWKGLLVFRDVYIAAIRQLGLRNSFWFLLYLGTVFILELNCSKTETLPKREWEKWPEKQISVFRILFQMTWFKVITKVGMYVSAKKGIFCAMKRFKLQFIELCFGKVLWGCGTVMIFVHYIQPCKIVWVNWEFSRK